MHLVRIADTALWLLGSRVELESGEGNIQLGKGVRDGAARAHISGLCAVGASAQTICSAFITRSLEGGYGLGPSLGWDTD